MTLNVSPLTLTENGPPIVCTISSDTASALLSSRLVNVEPWATGQYRLVPGLRVGAVQVGDGPDTLEVRVTPKVGIARLLFLLGYARDPGWQDTDVEVSAADDLLSAAVDALSRAAVRTLGYGVLQGYRTVDDALSLVRGRMLAGPQITRRFALPLPVEVRYDEYDADIPENQILLAACRFGLTVPRLRDDTTDRLLHVIARLDGVSHLTAGSPRPLWRLSRLNDRYQGALRLAELVLDHLSFETGGGARRAAGFVVSMWKVFEDFVTTALAEALSAVPGVTHTQPQYSVNLDIDGLVPMRPDLVHVHAGRPALVVDAKYKAERFDGYPNADAYQLLAYCTALGLDRGHLVYAKGNEAGLEYMIPLANVHISAHTLDLTGSANELIAHIRDLAATLTSGGCDTA